MKINPFEFYSIGHKSLSTKNKKQDFFGKCTAYHCSKHQKPSLG